MLFWLLCRILSAVELMGNMDGSVGKMRGGKFLLVSPIGVPLAKPVEIKKNTIKSNVSSEIYSNFLNS